MLSKRKGHLYIEDCNCNDLAKQFGTPLNVLSENQLRNNYRTWKNALSNAWAEGPVNILPSVKSNLTLATRHILSQEGAGCDTFGASELFVALNCGVNPELISVNGSSKSRSLLHQSIAVGAKITIDNPAELPIIQEEAAKLGKVAKVRFRLRLRNPDLEEATDFLEEEVPIKEILRIYKPGIPFEHAIKLGKTALAMPNIDLRGVHIHIARNTHRLFFWEKGIQNLVEMIADFHKAWDGWLPKEIDLGGGFAVQEDPSAKGIERVAESVHSEAIPSPAVYAEAIASILKKEMKKHDLNPEGITLEVEPGRAMYSNIGIHLTEVKGSKRETIPVPWKWVEVDTTALFLSSIVYEHSIHPHIIANKTDAPLIEMADIVGVSCTFDRIKGQAHLPTLIKGDLIAFLNTGAYEDAWSPNFNGLPRPATVLVNGDNAELVKRRETIEEVFIRDNVPNRFLV